MLKLLTWTLLFCVKCTVFFCSARVFCATSNSIFLLESLSSFHLSLETFQDFETRGWFFFCNKMEVAKSIEQVNYSHFLVLWHGVSEWKVHFFQVFFPLKLCNSTSLLLGWCLSSTPSTQPNEFNAKVTLNSSRVFTPMRKLWKWSSVQQAALSKVQLLRASQQRSLPFFTHLNFRILYRNL